MANHLAFLQIDVSDPEFHRHMLLMSQPTEDPATWRCSTKPSRAGELVRCDTARLARAISAIAGGSLISWAVFREGTAESWVRAISRRCWRRIARGNSVAAAADGDS